MNVQTLIRSLATTAVLIFGPAWSSAQDAKLPSVERMFVDSAPKILDGLREAKISRVGVLRFGVWKDGKMSKSTGAINANLARRLELALLLNNTVAPNQTAKQPLELLRNVGAVVTQNLTEDAKGKPSREALFKMKFPTQVGAKKVLAEAFLSGVVIVHRDRKAMDVQLYMFTKANPDAMLLYDPQTGTFRSQEPSEKTMIRAKVTPIVLTELGDSFRSVSLGKFQPIDPGTGKDTQEEPVSIKPADSDQPKVAPTKTPESPTFPEIKANPLELPEPPIRLELLQSKQPFAGGDFKAFLASTAFDTLDVEFNEGQAFIQGLKANHPIRIRLIRDKTSNRYGLALRLNGQNSLGMGTGSDAQARLWVFEKDRPVITLSGYQSDNNTLQPFLVSEKSLATDLASQMNFGDATGMITLTVFAEKDTSKKALPEIVSPKEKEKQVLEKKVAELNLPDPQLAKKSEDSASLVGSFLKQQEGFRPAGLLIPNPNIRIESKVRLVTFQRVNTPIMHVTIRYFDPNKK